MVLSLICTGGLPVKGMARTLDSPSQTTSDDGDAEGIHTKSLMNRANGDE